MANLFWKVFQEISAYKSSTGFVTIFIELFKGDFKINIAIMGKFVQYLYEFNKHHQDEQTTICERKDVLFSFLLK